MKYYESWIEKVILSQLNSWFQGFGIQRLQSEDPRLALSILIGASSAILSDDWEIASAIISPIHSFSSNQNRYNYGFLQAVAENAIQRALTQFQDKAPSEKLKLAYYAARKSVTLRCLKMGAELVDSIYEETYSDFFGPSSLGASGVLNKFTSVETWEKFKMDHFSDLLENANFAHVVSPWLDEVSLVVREGVQFNLEYKYNQSRPNQKRCFGSIWNRFLKLFSTHFNPN